MKWYMRNCPSCERELYYARKNAMDEANRSKRKCSSCAKLGRIAWNKGLRGMFSKKQLHKWSKERSGKGNAMYGCPSPMRGIESPMKGKHHSFATKRHLRELRLGKVTPNFNPSACKLIDDYGKKHGYHFQHALNGGEVHIIGYSVDGYDAKKNVVVEYYEQWHKNQVARDKKRKREIVKHLGCKFIEIWE